jgi:glycosyltransferase involved in cell wall biosynthesis
MTRLSAHMMVRDGATVVSRAIRSLGMIRDCEVCLVDCLSRDHTTHNAEQACADMEFQLRTVVLDESLFFRDSRDLFRHSLKGIFTGEPILRDWSLARNLGLSACRGQYVLKLDADDVCAEPEKLPALLDYLDTHPGVSYVACPYEVMRSAAEVRPGESAVDYRVGYTRLWRNVKEARFREVCHENVDHAHRDDPSLFLNAADGPLFCDRRDAPERQVRPDHLYFKTLLAELERADVAGDQVSDHLLLYLAEEAVVPAPEVVLEVLNRFRRRQSASQDDCVWAAFTEGRVREILGDVEGAAMSYEHAAACGMVRARLYRDVMCRRDPLGEDLLRTSVVLNQAQSSRYPRAASASELCRATRPDCDSLMTPS